MSERIRKNWKLAFTIGLALLIISALVPMAGKTAAGQANSAEIAAAPTSIQSTEVTDPAPVVAPKVAGDPAKALYTRSEPPKGMSKEEWKKILDQIQDSNAGPKPESVDLVKEIMPSDPAALDYFGEGAALFGDIAVVGIPNRTVGSNLYQGVAYVFQRNYGGLNNWGQVKKLVAPDGAAGDEFGWSVAVYEDIIAVGAPYCESGSYVNNGAVYIFSRNQGGADNWGLLKRVDSLCKEDNMHYGYALALYGEMLYISAPGHLGGGAVFINRRNNGAADNWGECWELYPSVGTGDNFGCSLAADGDNLAVGANMSDEGGNADQGAVYMYHQSSSCSYSVQKLVFPFGAAGDKYGSSVALEGKTLVVGSPYADYGATADVGAAHLYYYNAGGAGNWGLFYTWFPSVFTGGDTFGSSVSVSGDRILVSSHRYNSYEGKVFLYSRNQGGEEGWGEVSQIPHPEPSAPAGFFGRCATMHRDSIFVGFPAHDHAGPDSENKGAGYIFDLSRGWKQRAKRVSGDGDPDGQFGWSVASDGNVMVVGAPYEDATYTNQGAVYFFYRNGAGQDQWSLLFQRLASDPAQDAQFGFSLSLSGDILAVGSRLAAPCGAAYMLYRNEGGAEGWGEKKKVFPSDTSNFYLLGSSVSLSGETLLAGDTMYNNTGGAVIFKRHTGGTDNWGQVKVLVPPDGASADNFGWGASLFNDTAVVGSFGHTHSVSEQGSAYIFERNYGGMDNWGAVKELLAPIPRTDARFGYSAAIWGDTIAVGAPCDHETYANQGEVYVYGRNVGGADNWGISKSVIADVSVGDYFGTSLSMEGDYILAGAIGAYPEGAAYVLGRNHGGLENWGTMIKLSASDPELSSDFGTSVVLADGKAIVGANRKDQTFIDEGAVYVFHNFAPISADDTYTAYQNQQLVQGPTGGLFTNDSDQNGDEMLLCSVTDPSHGTVLVNEDGSFTYTPTPGYVGNDSFAYTVCDQMEESDPATVSISVLPSADVSVTKTDSPDPVCVNNTVTYTVTVSNAGPSNATAVMLDDSTDWWVSNLAATPSQGSCQVVGTTVTCDLGTINNGASAIVTITGQPILGGTTGNDAAASHGGFDPDIYNNGVVIWTTVDSPSPQAPEIVTVTDIDPCLVNGVLVSWEEVPTATMGYDLRVDSTVVSNVTSPYTYQPGDSNLHFYAVRSKNSCGTGDWSGNAPGTDSLFVPNKAIIEIITDDDPCGYGIAVGFSGGTPSNRWDLLRDGLVVIPGWDGATHYYPSDSLPHSYVVRSWNNGCYSDSDPYIFADPNGTPSMPAIDVIQEVDGCVQNGVKVFFTGGTPATGHALVVDSVEVATGVTSPVTYDPGDTAYHIYQIRSYNGACYSPSGGTSYADQVNAKPSKPQISSIVDNDACAATGITVTFSEGSPATTHFLVQDGTNVVGMAITSPFSYTPPDGLEHSYAVRAMNFSCTTDSDPANGTDANHTPVASVFGPDQNICPATVVNLTTDGGMSNYQWFKDGGWLSGATDSTFTATASGSYGATYTNSYGCTATIAYRPITINPCLSSPPPVADGVNGQAARFETSATAGYIDVTYGIAPCISEKAVILFGNIGSYGGYAECALNDAGNAGTASFNASAMENVWFNIIWTEAGIGGHPGYSNIGGARTERSWAAAGLCGIASDDFTDKLCD